MVLMLFFRYKPSPSSSQGLTDTHPWSSFLRKIPRHLNYLRGMKIYPNAFDVIFDMKRRKPLVLDTMKRFVLFPMRHALRFYFMQ